MSCHTLFKVRFNIVLVSVKSFQILLLQFFYKCLLFQQPGRNPGGGKSFFLLQTFGPALGPTQLPTQWIPG